MLIEVRYINELCLGIIHYHHLVTSTHNGKWNALLPFLLLYYCSQGLLRRLLSHFSCSGLTQSSQDVYFCHSLLHWEHLLLLWWSLFNSSICWEHLYSTVSKALALVLIQYPFQAVLLPGPPIIMCDICSSGVQSSWNQPATACFARDKVMEC